MKITIDIKVVDGIYYIRETNQLYSGPYVLYYKNGQKESKVVIKGGKENGLKTYWYENGQKMEEETFKDGELISQECWDEDGNEKECD